MLMSEQVIKQLQQRIKINEEIIANLEEFFGTYLSTFLKEYRNNNDQHNERLNKIFERQDKIYQKLHEIMKHR